MTGRLLTVRPLCAQLRSRRLLFPLASLVFFASCDVDRELPIAIDTGGPGASTGSTTPTPTAAPRKPAFTIAKAVEHGRIEDHAGLRLLRLWGSPKQRGHAHGLLLGDEAIALLRRELVARFGRQKPLLARARMLAPLMIAFPKPNTIELSALFRAVQDQGIDLTFPGFARKLDLKDLLLINAMDLLVQMGCSGFTVSGDQVEGGGVLTARNFDWPMTGPYLIESCLLIVQHPDDGAAFASVAWPGYVGVVTGVNERGVAVFLHYGNADGGMPRPGSYPTAVAARGILRQANATSAFAIGDTWLQRTCPTRGYLTRVVTPEPTADGPSRVFETDGAGVTFRKRDKLCVVTNHFLSRDEAPKRGDSVNRWTAIRGQLRRDLSSADHRVSVEEAWAALAAVQRSGQSFGTLHSLVFRYDPWCFELAIGTVTPAGGIGAAPTAGTRYRLSRDEVFATID